MSTSRRLIPADGAATDDGAAELERDALRIAIAVLAGSPPADEALARVLAAALAATEAELATLVERGTDGTLVVRASAGARALMPGTAFPAAPDAGAMRALDGHTVPTHPANGRASEAVVPVVVAGRPVGALCVTARHLPPRAHERLRAFAQLLGVVLTRVEDRRQLSALASTDPLTGLGNRRHFDERFTIAVEQARRHRQPLSLAMLDLDNFKLVNDTHGHQRGDEVLAEVARRLAATCRMGESVARIGGEEFAWVLPLTTGVAAEAAAQRAWEAVRGTPFESVGHLTVSIGVAELAPAEHAADLISRADAALYRAKDEGRDRIVLDTAGGPAPR